MTLAECVRLYEANDAVSTLGLGYPELAFNC